MTPKKLEKLIDQALKLGVSEFKAFKKHLDLTHLSVYIEYTGFYAKCCEEDQMHDGFEHKLTRTRKFVTCPKCRRK